MLEQRTPEWFAIRCGKATASRIADITARTKTGYGASRANYAAQLVAERLTGVPADSFSNAAMQWGVDHEPEAREAYCRHQLCTVAEIAFVDHPSIPMSGASPDGLVGEDGMVELKCPNTATHIDTLLGGGFADKYVKQALWQLACTRRAYCDLASYDPRLPESMRLFVQRIPFDASAVTALEAEVVSFLNEVDETVERLRARYDATLGETLKASLEAA
jgi:putative phage-type endonuclease